MAETKVEVNAKLKLWREALESKRLKISRNKTEYMKCNFEISQSSEDWVHTFSSTTPGLGVESTPDKV